MLLSGQLLYCLLFWLSAVGGISLSEGFAVGGVLLSEGFAVGDLSLNEWDSPPIESVAECSPSGIVSGLLKSTVCQSCDFIVDLLVTHIQPLLECITLVCGTLATSVILRLLKSVQKRRCNW